jgi:hypothetical protein
VLVVTDAEEPSADAEQCEEKERAERQEDEHCQDESPNASGKRHGRDDHRRRWRCGGEHGAWIGRARLRHSGPSRGEHGVTPHVLEYAFGVVGREWMPAERW